MRHRIQFGVLFAAVLFSTAAAQAQIPVCGPGTLASYIAMDGSCSLGILDFSAFTFQTAGSNASDMPSDIEVTPAIGGFSFSQVNLTPFSVALGQTAIYDIGYYFDPPPSQGAADLNMDPPFGNVTINQYYCANSALTQDSPTSTPFCAHVPVQTLTVTVQNQFDSIMLNPAVTSFANVLTMIDLDGTNGPSGFDAVTGDSFTTSATPEPASFMFAAGGLLLVAFSRRLVHVFR